MLTECNALNPKNTTPMAGIGKFKIDALKKMDMGDYRVNKRTINQPKTFDQPCS